MNIVTIFFTSLLVGLSGAVMPGPLLSVNIYGTLKAGVKRGLSTVIGHSIIEAATVISLLIGLKQFLSYKITQGIISMLGGCVLIWMGINMLRSVKGINLKLETLTAIFGGYILGYISYQTKSVLPCFIIHFGIYIMMRLFTSI